MQVASQNPQNFDDKPEGNSRVVKRELAVDLWRGIAVISMIVTHAIAFFHYGEDGLINFLGTLGGTISFGLFLFLSGISVYLSYIRYDNQTEGHKLADRRRKMLSRALWLLMGYYLISFIATIPLYSFPPNVSWIDNIASIALFINVPEFTEFILAFVFYLVLVIPFRKFFRFIVRNPILLLIVGAASYGLGWLLYQVEVGEPAVYVKALLAGEADWHRFPLLQYLVVYLLGMLWGRFLVETTSIERRKRISFFAIIASILMIFAGNTAQNYLDLPWLETFHRWPPSLTFIGMGLLASYVVYWILLRTNNLRFSENLRTGIHFMGVNAFDFFIIHTALLFIYKYVSGDQHHSSSILVFLMLGMLLAITAVITILKQSVTESVIAEARQEGMGWVFSEKVVVSITWIVIILLTGMAVFQGNIKAETIPAEQIALRKRLIREQEWPFWWDHAYDNFQQIFISNNGDNPIARNTWYEFSLNHSQLVKQNRSKKNGADVRIVFYNEDRDSFIELPFDFTGINTSNSRMRFKLQEGIMPDTETDKYFVYYGNIESNRFPKTKEQPVAVSTSGIKLGAMNSHRLSGNVNRRWVLREDGLSLQVRTIRFTVTLNPDMATDSIVTYNVVGSSVRGTMDSIGNRKYQASVDVSDLLPGEWKLQAIAREPENKLRLIQSGYTSFLVTYPLYVVWTQDWEGWDVPDQWLTAINEMANRYRIPMTHFFNPRIYIPSVMNRKRADQLTLWVQERAKEHNDEIGLHLHMFYDLVRAAGVTPRSNNYAPWLYGDGGGVAAYSYPVNEMKKILQWSQRQFLDNGLSSPISFRAGGWLAKENTLQALEETGFLIDSSGRTAFSSKGFPVPWNLKATTRPYKPNRNDQNSAKEPTMEIWEFPNNGADAYWFDAKELIRRFDVNYPNKGGVLLEPQVLNYLSHPPFYPGDRPKLEQLWAYVTKFQYRNDDGPVVFTTLQNAYYSWDKGEEL